MPNRMVSSIEFINALVGEGFTLPKHLTGIEIEARCGDTVRVTFHTMLDEAVAMRLKDQIIQTMGDPDNAQ